MAYTTMTELMQDYTDQMAEKNWSAAHEILLSGVQCGHLPARLELARLYKDCKLLGISQQERYIKAEYHYRSILNLLEISELSDRVTATLCIEMAELYSYMRRSVGLLAMLLRAKRHGADVPERDIDHARQLWSKMDIGEFAQSARDAFDLAVELSMAGGSARLIELLFREATESGQKLIRGKAALALADFYNERRNESDVYAKEAARYYRVAMEEGYPEYLSGYRN